MAKPFKTTVHACRECLDTDIFEVCFDVEEMYELTEKELADHKWVECFRCGKRGKDDGIHECHVDRFHDPFKIKPKEHLLENELFLIQFLGRKKNFYHEKELLERAYSKRMNKNTFLLYHTKN